MLRMLEKSATSASCLALPPFTITTGLNGLNVDASTSPTARVAGSDCSKTFTKQSLALHSS
jgi:hypothetical protein